MPPKTGVLLINLGTPDDLSVKSVRRYLRQFLSDPRVINLPSLARWLLLNLFILPLRPRRSSEAYSQIWTDAGSPIKIHSEALTKAVQKKLGDAYSVTYAMRYQNPSIDEAMSRFDRDGIDRIIVVPLYPQYASAATGSTLERVYRTAARGWHVPALTVVPPFYDHPSYVLSVAEAARDHIKDWTIFDRVLFSFHGLPEDHVQQGAQAATCLQSDHCCDRITHLNRFCYRAHCMATAHAVAHKLGISNYDVSFQSRLGRKPWLKPFTDQVLIEFPAMGYKSIAVFSLSFTADCLETLEEIGIRGAESFKAAGGEVLELLPCLNDHPVWVDSLVDIIKDAHPTG